MRLCSDFILRNVCGDYLLVPLGEKAKEYNGVFTLTDTGAFILEKLSEQKDLKETAELLANEFEIDAASAYEDAVVFTDSLLKQGILEE